MNVLVPVNVMYTCCSSHTNQSGKSMASSKVSHQFRKERYHHTHTEEILQSAKCYFTMSYAVSIGSLWCSVHVWLYGRNCARQHGYMIPAKI